MKFSTMVVGSGQPEFSFGNFKLRPDGTLFSGETETHLTPKELAALRFLLEHAGQVVTPGQLKQALWGDVHVSSDSVPRCMSSLRSRLEPEQCIQTVYKRGYRLTGLVQGLGAKASTALRLAIVPFAVGHNVAEHLGPAIAEEVTARLTTWGPSGISVLARDSVFTLAQRGLTAVQIGEALNADLVLGGTLLALPMHYRLRVEVIRVKDGTQIWVEDMLAANTQIVALQSELVQRLAFRIGSELSAASSTPPFGWPTSARPDAYRLYLRGHQEWQTHERHRMLEGMNRLVQATELDPSLIAAQVDLAHACLTQESYGFMAPDVAAKQIRHIEEIVSDISGTAPLLLPSLGWVSFHVDRDLGRAVDMYSTAGHLPHDPYITRLRVMFALGRHRFDEALGWLQEALLVDPYAPWLHARLAWVYHLAGQAGKSLEEIEKSLALFPEHESSHLFGAMILAFNGQSERAAQLSQELLRRSPYFDIAIATHAYVLAGLGRQKEAYAELERLQWLSRERFVLRSFSAAAYVALGDFSGALVELRAANDMRCPWLFELLADPRLKALQGRSEFEQMGGELERMEAAAAEALVYQ